MEKQWKQWETLFFGGSKITADGDCSHEIKGHLLLGSKAMTKPRQHIKKQRHYFANKGPSSQSYGFSSSHIWFESWTIKKAEYWRIDAFKLCCWGKLLKVPWTAKRSNQSILKEINPECSLEGQMLKLKFLGRADSLEKNLIGKIEGRQEGGNRGWDGWMASSTQWTWVWVNSRR